MQTELKEGFVEFTDILTELDDDYHSEAADINTRLKFIKTAAGTTNPLPSYRLKELENILEEEGQKIYKFQTEISEHYDKMVKATKRLKVPDSDKELFKAVANHLQVDI